MQLDNLGREGERESERERRLQGDGERQFANGSLRKIVKGRHARENQPFLHM
jgi:hypothetical protein